MTSKLAILLLVACLAGCRSAAVITPFGLHCATCDQCSSDCRTEEGYPCALCNEGFRLLEEDVTSKAEPRK